jgi:alkylation response protein AidB-like acyl-CoA dehydrogenase
MPSDLVEKLRKAGLFRLGMPAALGGDECDPFTIIDTMEEIARADGSAGWTTFIGNTNFSMAWLEPAVAKEIASHGPDLIVAAGFSPSGTARPDGSNFVVDGRWAFSSGSPHADWFVNAAVVTDGDNPRGLPPGQPSWRLAFIPARDTEIIDTWHAAGLRGTGSHDVTATAVRVPQERTAQPYFESAKFDGPLYRLPYAILLSAFMSPFPLGVARRALDEFATLAHKKSRTLPPGAPMAEDAAVQVELAHAEATLRSARSFLVEALGVCWNSVCAGDPVSLELQTTALLASLNGARAARNAVETVYGMSGAGAALDASPMQRCVRDLMVGTQHIAFSMTRWASAGRAILGLDPATFMLRAP